MEKFNLPLLYVRGFPFPDFPFYSKQKIESALDYEAKHGDVFLVAYPRSGVTWMAYMLWEILHHGIPLPPIEEMTYRLIPYLEMCGAPPPPGEGVSSEPRLYKFHCPYELTPMSPEAKYIYLYRNPKDTLVSRYFFTQEMMGRKFELDEYVDVFLSGRLAHGLWSDNVMSWYKRRLDENVLFISFEQLHGDRRKMLLKLASFLGDEYLSALENDEDLVNRILRITSFEYMKENIPVPVPVDGPQDSDGKRQESFRFINFFRKGEPGDWMNYLSDEQSEKVDQHVLTKFKDTELLRNLI